MSLIYTIWAVIQGLLFVTCVSITLIMLVGSVVFKDLKGAAGGFMYLLISIVLGICFVGTPTGKEGESKIIEPTSISRTEKGNTVVIFTNYDNKEIVVTDSSAHMYIASNVLIKATEKLNLLGNQISWKYNLITQ